MIFKNMKLLNDVVLDYSNPQKLYDLACEYDRLEQGAAAFGFYLRAADMADEENDYERWIQYKCMILSSFIYDRNRGRDQTVIGLLKIAIETMPKRPEAYYYLSKFLQYKNEWRDSMVYAKMGIENTSYNEIDEDLNFPGMEALKLVYARAKWKTDGRDKSKNLAFDLKYKHILTPEIDAEVTELLGQHGYPSTLPYTEDLLDRLKFKFRWRDHIQNNYSRHFQDIFVLSVLDGKENGTFVEIGSGHPTLFNNTKLLEDNYNWKGISIDNSERMSHIFSRERNTSMILADASQIDYKTLFKQNCVEDHIDFLRINADQASLQALKNIPFSNYEFSVIQFQHNACWWGGGFREHSRNILQKIGYVLLVPDVAVNEKDNYEDWWVHPAIAKTHKYMQGKDGINFAWSYMMKELV
jgi:hypothetical protein